MKKIIIYICLFFISLAIQAQEKSHYLYFNVGGGQHNIDYTVLNGTVKNGLGLTSNIGYNYFFEKHWGIGTGIGFQSFHTGATLNYVTSHPATDADGETYNYRTYFSNFRENQKIRTLDVPIGFIFKSEIGSKVGLLVSIGGKASFPVFGNYEMVGGQIETRGYYPQYDVELANMPNHNFVTITQLSSHAFDSKVNWSVFGDLGGTWKIRNYLDLYYGVYLNYNWYDIQKRSNKFVYEEDGVYNGIFGSNQTDRIKLISFGFKIGVSYQLHKGGKPAKKE